MSGEDIPGCEDIHHPFIPLPLHLPPLPAICCSPRKEDSLEKAVGSGSQPEGVDEDCSADVCVMVQQAGLPWPLASHHVLATIDLPHHLGFPTHCGEIPLAYDRETGGIPNATTREALLHLTRGKSKAKGQVAWQKSQDCLDSAFTGCC